MPYLVLTRRGAEQLHVRLDQQPVLIGRGSTCDLHVFDRAIARHQAAILPDGGRYRLEDRSGQKTLVNGKPVEGAVLADRDYLELGAYRLHFHDAELSDDGPDPSRIRTLVSSRVQPSGPTLGEEVWLNARATTGGSAIRVKLGSGVEIGSEVKGGLQLPGDSLVSRRHAAVTREGSRLVLRDLDSQNGTWARGLWVHEMKLPVDEPFQVGGYTCWVSAAEKGVAANQELAWEFEGIVGKHELMLQLFAQILAVAPGTAPVAITGETGSGKDLVASAIHRRSDRPHGPFIPVNCAALAGELFESQLFGHTKGSYTGADRASRGLFGEADGGTLFLDEIGDLPMPLQTKLLRAVESGEVLPVGASKPEHMDVRVVTGTHRDLQALVRLNRFREDLFFRLNVLSVRVPPLRRRLEDVPYLWDHFVARFTNRPMRPTLTPEVTKLLLAHPWTGNVRELRNVVQRALSAMGGSALLPQHLTLDPASKPLPQASDGVNVDALSLAELELLGLRSALVRNKGNRTRAAEELKISRSTLKRKIAEHGLEREGLGDAEEGEGEE